MDNTFNSNSIDTGEEMIKQELIELFDMFAKTSIKIGDYGYYLYGHNVMVEPIGDIWDVYLCNAKKFREGDYKAHLGTGKINNICKTLPDSVEVRRLDGEAYFQTRDINWLKTWLYDNRKTLGIAKRKKTTRTTFNVQTP